MLDDDVYEVGERDDDDARDDDDQYHLYYHRIKKIESE